MPWPRPGQTISDQRTDDDGTKVVELTYQHDGVPWWQGHWAVPYSGERLLIITAQAFLSHAGPTREAAEAVVSSLA